MSEPELLSASATARKMGISPQAILTLYRDGVIDAEVHEGRLIRFDVEKVRKVLANRAKANRHEVHIPDGMVPTC